MKQLLLALSLLFGYNSLAQYVIKGEVLDEYGKPIPGARVSLENSTYGVPTNMKGNYFLEVEEKGVLVVKFSMLGFETSMDTIEVADKINILNVVLEEKATDLNTVEIYADKKDIAKEVIKHVSDNKKYLDRSFDSYECNTYIKTSLEKEPRFPDLMAKGENSLVPVGRQRMNFIESYSVTKFKQSGTYKETILAHHDYAEKSNSSVVVTADYSDPDNILPTQVIEYNPYIFFEKVQDGDFNPYQNLIDLPKVSSKPLVSPVAFNGPLNYKYTLNSVFYENGQKIYEIGVEPRFSEAPLFSGSLFIIDSLWVIKSMDLSINSSSMEYFKDFRIIQDYEYIDSNWVPVRREFIYTINDGKDVVLANTRVDHTNYEFNKEYDNKEFKNVLMIYEEDAFDKDSSYWAETRPLQLKQEELAFIQEQDSIRRELTSNEYIDSVNAEYNKLTVWDFLLNGVGFRNRAKGQEIYLIPLIQQPNFFGIGGYRHKFGGMYEKEFSNAQRIRTNGKIDYGFRNQDVKGDLAIEYTYLPRHFGSFKISGGDNYDVVNNYESIANSFSPTNYVRKTFVGFSQRYEIVNGLYGKIGFDYSIRRSIDDLQLAPYMDSLFSMIGGDIQPQPFPTYTVSIFELELLYRFRQSYILKGNKKIVIGTEYPELKFTYKLGVPDLFGSDVNFSFIEVGASDEIEFGTMGNTKWNFVTGTFLAKDVDSIKFIEHKFFRGSDWFFFSNPLKSLQLLDSTFHTARPYMQAYGIHHFNGAIMSKIPLINKLKLELVVGAGALLIQDYDYFHFEFYGGIERKFKIRKQLFKIGTYYVLRENNAPSVNLNLKFGIDFFNSWNNSWSY